MPVVVVGTRNPKKLEEIREILGDLPIELRDLTQYPDAPAVVEEFKNIGHPYALFGKPSRPFNFAAQVGQAVEQALERHDFEKKLTR